MVVSRPGHGMEILSKPESGKGLFKPNGQGLHEIRNPFRDPGYKPNGSNARVQTKRFKVSVISSTMRLPGFTKCETGQDENEH